MDASRGGAAAVSLDEVDFASYHAGPAPMDLPPKEIALVKGRTGLEAGPVILRLDGAWQMAENGSQTDRLTQSWADAIPATVPGSVHGALQAAGKISFDEIDSNILRYLMWAAPKNL